MTFNLATRTTETKDKTHLSSYKYEKMIYNKIHRKIHNLSKFVWLTKHEKDWKNHQNSEESYALLHMLKKAQKYLEETKRWKAHLFGTILVDQETADAGEF